MWALLALLTDASGAVPPFLLSAITFAIGTCVGLAARLVFAAARSAAEDPVAGLADRHCRPVRLPLLLFHRAAQRAGGGGEPDRLSVAAVHRARLGADAGRAAALASCRRRLARACRHGADRHQGRRRFLRRPLRLRLRDGRRLRLRLVGLFAAVAALRRSADQHRHLVLRRHLGAFARLPFRAGRDGAAAGSPANGLPCSASA